MLFVLSFSVSVGNSRQLSWDVSKWGHWIVNAKSRNGYSVEIDASTTESGTVVYGPTSEGMVPNILDAMRGTIYITLRDPLGNLLLDKEACHCAQVEIGGGPWNRSWTANVKSLPQPLRGLINLLNGPKVSTCT